MSVMERNSYKLKSPKLTIQGDKEGLKQLLEMLPERYREEVCLQHLINIIVMNSQLPSKEWHRLKLMKMNLKTSYDVSDMAVIRIKGKYAILDHRRNWERLRMRQEEPMKE